MLTEQNLALESANTEESLFLTYGLETPPRINLQCTCTGQILNRNDSTILVQGQVAKVAVALGVTEEWGDLVVVARFRHEGSLAIYDIRVDENYEVEIPHEMTDDVGTFSMSLRGEGDNRVITSSPVAFTVIETINGKGKTSEPTETILDRFSEASKKAQESADLAKTYADSANAAKSSASSSEAKAKTYSETAKSSETIAVENANKSQALLDEAKRLDRFHVNYLTKTESDDSFIHVEDAFEGGRLRGFKIKGKCEQITTTGANLWPQIESFKMDGVVFEPCPDRHGHADRGMVRVSGTSTVANVYAGVRVDLEPGTYSFKNFGRFFGNSASTAGAIYLRVRVISASGSQSTHTAFADNSTSFTVSEGDTVYTDVMLGAPGSVEGVVMPMLVKGSMPPSWEQYTGGKVSPSREYQQEIDVADSISLLSAGRTICELEESSTSTYSIKKSDNLFKVSATGVSTFVHIREKNMKPKNVSFDSRIGRLNGCSLYLYPRSYTSGRYAGLSSAYAYAQIGDVYANDYEKIRNHYFGFGEMLHLLTGKIFDDAIMDLSVQAGSVFHQPPEHLHETKTAIPLPPEHPYLASLPDGTCDEIAVDETGHAVLTARIFIKKIADLVRDSDNPNVFFCYNSITRIERAPVLASRYASNEAGNINAPAYRTVSVNGTVYIADGEPFTDDAKAATNNDTLYLALETPVTYDLGYIDMPFQQDRYCNFWVDTGDKETDPICPLEVVYERDVNIVIEDLEKQLSSS